MLKLRTGSLLCYSISKIPIGISAVEVDGNQNKGALKFKKILQKFLK